MIRVVKMFELKTYRGYRKYYDEYLRNQEMLVSDLAELSFRKLKETIDYANLNVEFYRNLWSEYGINTNIQSLEDFKQFPIISKSQLIEAIKNGTALSRQFKQKDLYFTQTTGSTGTPLKFPLDKQSVNKRYANVRRVHGWFSYEYGINKSVKLWRGETYPNYFSRIKNRLMNYMPITIYDPNDPGNSQLSEGRIKEIVNCIVMYEPCFIDGFVSALTMVAKYIIENDISMPKTLKVVTTGAEYLSLPARELIRTAFGVPVLNRYGGTETSLIAHETLEDELAKTHFMSVTTDLIYPEIYRNGQLATTGIGEIVVTDFSNRAMPFIKYKNGDMAEWVLNNDSKSELPFPKFKEVFGRVNDLFLLPNGSYLSSHIWHNYFRGEGFIDNFQIVQLDKFNVEVSYVTESEDLGRLNLLKDRVSKALPGCHVYWKKVEYIEVGSGGKFRHSISHLDIDLNKLR